MEPYYALPSQCHFSDVASSEVQSFVSSHSQTFVANASRISFSTNVETLSASPPSLSRELTTSNQQILFIHL